MYLGVPCLERLSVLSVSVLIAMNVCYLIHPCSPSTLVKCRKLTLSVERPTAVFHLTKSSRRWLILDS